MFPNINGLLHSALLELILTLIIHARMLKTSTRHAVISIVAASSMFLGSKIGREFLGIK